MAILDIQTQNPDVSWVIYKNPQTQENKQQPFERKLRQGKVYGWYNDHKNFRILFKDREGKSSFYKHLNNGYLDQSAYNCPYTYCAMMNEMLSSTSNKKHEKDIDINNKIVLSSILITNINIAKAFINYFSQDVEIKMEAITHKIYRVSFEAHSSLYYLTNLAQIFCLIQSLEDKNIYIDLTEGALKKYAQTLININAPYFIVYLFTSRCIPDFQSFELVKDILSQQGWVLHFGNTQRQRFYEIKKLIEKGEILNDLGCGELYYSRHFASYYDEVYAWDAEESIQKRNSEFIKRKQLNNIVLKGAFEKNSIVDIQPGSDILITEMLEHMPKEKAKEVLLGIKTTAFRRLIITVPNIEFNQFYKLDTPFRHDDHHWEPTYDEMSDWITDIFEGFNINIKKIGDGIDGIHVSTLVMIERK